jgi:hypothetical protein
MSERDAPIKEITVTSYVERDVQIKEITVTSYVERDVQIKEIAGYLVCQRGTHQ